MCSKLLKAVTRLIYIQYKIYNNSVHQVLDTIQQPPVHVVQQPVHPVQQPVNAVQRTVYAVKLPKHTTKQMILKKPL